MISDISSNKSKKSLNDFTNCMPITPLINTTPQVPNIQFPAKTFTNDIQAEAVDFKLMPNGGNSAVVSCIAH